MKYFCKDVCDVWPEGASWPGEKYVMNWCDDIVAGLDSKFASCCSEFKLYKVWEFYSPFVEYQNKKVLHIYLGATSTSRGMYSCLFPRFLLRTCAT